MSYPPMKGSSGGDGMKPKRSSSPFRLKSAEASDNSYRDTSKWTKKYSTETSKDEIVSFSHQEQKLSTTSSTSVSYTSKEQLHHHQGFSADTSSSRDHGERRSSGGSASLLLMKQPLLQNTSGSCSVSRPPSKPTYSVANPHISQSQKHYASDHSQVSLSSHHDSPSSANSSSSAGHHFGPLKVQVSLMEREELLRRLDGEDTESCNELRRFKNARKVSQKFQMQGTMSIADRMAAFDTGSAEKMRMRSPGPTSSAYQQTTSSSGFSSSSGVGGRGDGASSSASITSTHTTSSSRTSYQKSTPSYLDEISGQTSTRSSLSVVTDDRNYLTTGDNISCTRSSSVRLLKHTSPVPYKRPETPVESSEPESLILPSRRATIEAQPTVQGPVVDETVVDRNKRTSSLKQESETNVSVAKTTSNHPDQASKSLQMRRKFFMPNPTVEVSVSHDVLSSGFEDGSFTSRTSSVSEGSNQSNAYVQEAPMVASVAGTSETVAPSQYLELKPFNDPGSSNTIGRKKRPSLTTAGAHLDLNDSPTHGAFSATSIVASVMGTMKRMKKPNSAATETKTHTSLKEHSTLQKTSSISHKNYTEESFESYERSTSVSASSSKAETPSKEVNFEEMKTFEYLIRHAEILSMNSLPYCRHSIASRVDLNQMMVANTINEMIAIYGAPGAKTGTNSKPMKPPRSDLSTISKQLRISPVKFESAYQRPEIAELVRKLSIDNTIQPDAYIELSKPPPKPTRSSIRSVTSLMHSSTSSMSEQNVDLRTIDLKVFSHKYPPTVSSTHKSKFLKGTLPRFPKRPRRSTSRNKGKCGGVEVYESASVPPKFGEETARIQLMISAKLDQKAKAKEERKEQREKSGTDKSRIQSCFDSTGNSEMIQPYTSSQSSVDTIDGHEQDDVRLSLNNSMMTGKSQSVDNLRNVSFSLESMKSAEVVGHCTDKSLDGCCDTEQLSEQSKRDESIDNQQCKKIQQQKFPNVGRSISCREQKPGTNLEKRELVRLKRRIKRLHKSVDQISNTSSSNNHTKAGMTPSTSTSSSNAKAVGANLNQNLVFHPLTKDTTSASRPNSSVLTSQSRQGQMMNKYQQMVNRIQILPNRVMGKEAIEGKLDAESLNSAGTSDSSDRLNSSLDERVRDKIYHMFGVAKSLEDLNCDSANETSSEGLERVDHKDLDSLDEPDGIQNASLEKGKLTNTRGGIRQRSGAFDNEAACDSQSVGRDSALSLNQDQGGNNSVSSVASTSDMNRIQSVQSEDERIMIVALHVGLKTRQIEGGGVQYSPVTITSYPHKDIIDPKERPFFAHVPNFCFPDAGGSEPPKQTELDETYSFIFTDDKGAQMFGYCRRIWPDDALGSPNKSGRVSVVSATSTQSATSGMSKLHDEDLPTVYCIISQQRCFELFDKICSELKTLKKEIHIFTFLQSLYECATPSPGNSIKVKYPFYIRHPHMREGETTLEITRSYKDTLYEHVNLHCLPLYMEAKNLVMVFASLLLERKVWLWSSKLNVLSSCAMALHALLYPFKWEHVFVPMTSMDLGCDLATCPTPFLIGSLVPQDSKLRPDVSEYDQVLIVDLDNRASFVKSCGDEKKLLPERYFTSLKRLVFDRKSLQKTHTVDIATTGTGEYISECFLHFFVQLLYQVDAHVEYDPTRPDGPLFMRNSYIQTRSKELRPFLRDFTDTMLFNRFLQNRSPFEVTRFNSRLTEYHLHREKAARTQRNRKGPKLFPKFSRRKSVMSYQPNSSSSNSNQATR
ncbi:mucin-3B-like isoform X3 [Symsagittifera roscoffensis]|uniref:mucin-3B-like isoform X3 n=1 Tax=Symsagittifera roscoffensis TaxID=84072 RepID=UPI00307C94EA